MSAIRAKELQDLAGNIIEVSDVITQIGGVSARANLNGTGVISLRSSFNISSVVRNGVGDYTFNFTTTFPDTNYTVTGICQPTIGVVNQGNRTIRIHTLTTGSCRVVCGTEAGVPEDQSLVSIVFTE